ncbi:MAG: MFS transporter [Candidatus Dormibacteraeota bacterium]|nr:MFS transporter [Candidatus Dormibacteraeota bacterium]
MSAAAPTAANVVESDIPARLDRLPWSRWHWMVVLALGVTWILDGIEVTIVGNVSATLQKPEALGLSAAQIGQVASAYVAGAVAGAIGFGYLTDRLGRKKLFLVTLGWYTIFTVLTGFSWSFWPLIAFRVLTGIGIGGEYAAINSAIDELIPARRRGRVDLGINASYWAGSAMASGLSLLLLDPRIVPIQWGWRVAFLIGAGLALAVMLVRTMVPESPRWLLTHGFSRPAEEMVRHIEHGVEKSLPGSGLPTPSGERVAIDQRRSVGFFEIARTMAVGYPRRTFVALMLMVGQAFLYNAVFFTMGITLQTFFKVGASLVPLYVIPFALGNLVGPLVLGRLFDSVGRRAMISGTYVLSGLLLVGTGLLFVHGLLSAVTLTACWIVVFFFGSAGASASYLTGSEIFPMETRAMAIGFIYAVGTAAGGIVGPMLFGQLVQSGQPSQLLVGYLIGAGLMIFAGLIQAGLGVDAEQRSLEDVAQPLTARDQPARWEAAIESP